ncbi:hypothetical protein, partial [Pseudomonas viridiflava]|uniref:hypothetical protein n=1 Tax=Pseudomonas viridiflava TaxID=33069 RepID=UPI00197DF26E
VALSRSRQRTVEGGLPAMNDDAAFLTHRVDCIAGKRAPKKNSGSSVAYRLFEKVAEPWNFSLKY